MSERVDRREDPSGVSLVDPRLPRFGQAITAALLVLGVTLQRPAFVYVVAVILGVSVVSRWRFDLYRYLWRGLVGPLLGPPEDPEPVTPHRFTRLLGATASVLAGALLAVGFETAGYVVAAAIGLLAAIAAGTGFCLGCRMYRQVSVLRRRGVL